MTTTATSNHHFSSHFYSETIHPTAKRRANPQNPKNETETQNGGKRRSESQETRSSTYACFSSQRKLEKMAIEREKERTNPPFALARLDLDCEFLDVNKLAWCAIDAASSLSDLDNCHVFPFFFLTRHLLFFFFTSFFLVFP